MNYAYCHPDEPLSTERKKSTIMPNHSNDSNRELPGKQNASDHLANERTLLAWVRTAIGIMAFGFVVVKFSLFIRQIALVLGKDARIPHYGYSGPIGVLLVATGSVSLGLSLIRYYRTKQRLLSGGYQHNSGILYALVTLLLLISLALIAYLIGTM